MNDIPEEQQQQSPQYLQQESPGTRLRQAREAAGLSRGEVALHMHINERKVAALEEDNYEMFPSETFVSGYLRSYAKVLGLSENDFVRPVSSSPLSPSLVSSISTGKQASSMDLPVRMVSYGIVVLVVASLAMWLISQREKGVPVTAEQAAMVQDNTTPSSVDTVTAEQETPVVSEEATLMDDAKDEAGATEENQVTAAPVPETVAVAAENKAVEQPVEQPKPAVMVQRDPAAPPKLVSQNAMANSTSAEAVTDDAAAPVPPPLTDAIPRSTLVLEYQNDSWTEVSDNAGRQLAYGLIRAGQTIELKGEAPFSVFLGYAEGVTVHYNNNLFDHSVFRRGKVARFHVGRAEDNKPGSR